MTPELIKRMIDACYLGKRARELLPPLPAGVLPSYIQCLDVLHRLERSGLPVKISDISDAMNLPRPGVTRTVKEMEAKGYLKKTTSEADGRITYLSTTEAGQQLWEKYDAQYFARLLPDLEGIPDADAETMIRTIETLYHVLCERRNDV